jgi:arabinogalactan endo-1,4-beta-galactosidase
MVLSSGDASASAPFELNGWQVWSTPVTGAVQVSEGGTATVTVEARLAAGAWGALDDFTLTLVPATGGDTSALEDALADAQAVDRSAYTEKSLAALDEAVAIANVVLGATAPGQAQLDAALEVLTGAIDALTVRDRVAPVVTLSVDRSQRILVRATDEFPGIARVEYSTKKKNKPATEWTEVTGPIRIDAATTITVRAVDGHGNVTEVTETLNGIRK